MSRDIIGAAVVGLLVLAALAMFGSGLVGVTSRTETTAPVPLPEPPRDGAAGLVEAKRVEPHSLWGFTWGRKSHAITVRTVVPPGCESLLGGDEPDGGRLQDCPAILFIGEPVGEGRTMFGDRLAGLRLEVSRACFEAVNVGDPWPNKFEECAGSGGGGTVQ